ncbi:protein FAR1-RELATED SEQUENCE 6-like [Phalaenopsis equestris]|uniref:protein FAR1-RELATED SEQUENCE 6-like n=1 Tax=Phalaenopsis equestris TaxID=78828 RepID=UPI0009E61430|nr:protein FAR1-RELATED SEQUENCE 6-like [Phalaenopsis equestris]
MTANGSLMDAPFGANEIDKMKDVESNDMVPSNVNNPPEMLKDVSKKDELNEIVTTADNVDDEERVVGKIGSNNDDPVPTVGMVFKTYDEASNYYKQYALRVGFGVAVKKSSFSKSGVCRRLILGCSRGGRGRADACYLARQSAKTNCEAMIAVKLWGDGLLHVVDAKLEHNHPVSPSTAQFLRCYRKMAHTTNHVRHCGPRNSHCVDKDCINMMEIGRLKLGEGDDEAIHQFFSRMQNKNPQFFYSVDLDEHSRMRNLFWADARSRAANRYFGDVVAFDTTCLTEKHDMPLVSIVGVNHHGQSVLLGCGLLSKETVETYVWFFKTWLTCMMDCHPNAIITDLCKPIQDAVAEVFCRSRHRLCLHNIMKKVHEKLRGQEEFKAIKKEIKKLVYDSLRAYEFEREWKEMIENFGLVDKEWLINLYNQRHSWVPLFLKDTFWAGMSVTQRGESLSTYFDGCVYPRTTIKHFLSKYETIIQSKCKKEAQADSESFHKTPLIASKFYMEEQLSKLYTINMFQKFQDELKATMYCHASPIKIDGSVHIFEVKECSYIENGKRTQSKDHEVFFNAEELAIQCICGFFQFNGILCRHSLSVFMLQQVFEIPSHYILNRWKKDFKRLQILANSNGDIVSENLGDRHYYLSMRFLELVEVGFLSEERYQLALKLMRELEKVLLDGSGCRERQPRLLGFETQPSQQEPLASRFVTSDCNKSLSSLQTKRRGRPQKRFEKLNLESLVRTNKEQDFLRSSLPQSETTPVLQPASASLHQDLMEEVNLNELSFSAHFGMHVNQEQIGSQPRMQPSNLFQVQYEQQALGTPTRMPWLYNQMKIKFRKHLLLEEMDNREGASIQ